MNGVHTEGHEYPILDYRAYVSIILSWGLVIFACYLCLSVSWMFYPLSLFIIVNRMVGFMFLSHEALHGVLVKNKKINNFLGRYLCSFPVLMSFTKFKKTHLRHHMFLNDEKRDPNHPVAAYFPVTIGQVLKRHLWSFFRLRLFSAFMLDNSEAYEIFYKYSGRHKIQFRDREHIAFLLFVFLIVAICTWGNFWWEFLLLYILPLLLFHAYIVLMTGLQHSPIRQSDKVEESSRNITGPKWLMELLLPFDVNFHATHHFDPKIPHYWLREATEEIGRIQGVSFWTQTYMQSCRELFRNSNIEMNSP